MQIREDFLHNLLKDNLMDTTLEMELEEDFAFLKSLREVSDYELERGKPMPTQQHSLTQLNLSTALKIRYRKQFVILPELTIELGKKTAVPDISIYPYYPIEWGAEDPAAKAEPPLVAIEIISPSQTLTEIRDKARKYFAQGVKSCWIVQPELQTISVLHPGEKPRTFDTGMVEDTLVGIQIPIEEVFE
ncbi:MAG: Uma2 family endonuclease [Candidatus Kapaibacteriota bacterium]